MLLNKPDRKENLVITSHYTGNNKMAIIRFAVLLCEASRKEKLVVTFAI